MSFILFLVNIPRNFTAIPISSDILLEDIYIQLYLYVQLYIYRCS